ncbi:hypothetical protein BDN72DRAFT_864543 [Pluteus cervinus]|uniref:Uncharacterized protein n=1 Tax=Pluteus cervinus TaxID=181527 RepID=A0ACD3A3C0_9AGAR|nr:hypothetical protein BDN72DRAFT_864543 [Pluteus cervinus]
MLTQIIDAQPTQTTTSDLAQEAPAKVIKLRRSDRKPKPVKYFTTQPAADKAGAKRAGASKAREGKLAEGDKPKATKAKAREAVGGPAEQTGAIDQRPTLPGASPVPMPARGMKRRLEESREETGRLQVHYAQPAPLRKDGVPLWLQRKWLLSELRGNPYPDFAYRSTKRVRIENETEGV